MQDRGYGDAEDDLGWMTERERARHEAWLDDQARERERQERHGIRETPAPITQFMHRPTRTDGRPWRQRMPNIMPPGVHARQQQLNIRNTLRDARFNARRSVPPQRYRGILQPNRRRADLVNRQRRAGTTINRAAHRMLNRRVFQAAREFVGRPALANLRRPENAEREMAARRISRWHRGMRAGHAMAREVEPHDGYMMDPRANNWSLYNDQVPTRARQITHRDRNGNITGVTRQRFLPALRGVIATRAAIHRGSNRPIGYGAPAA